MMSGTYDGWKTTDSTECGCEHAHDEATCDCGQPLAGGEHGLCTDCVREARNFAADCSKPSFEPRRSIIQEVDSGAEGMLERQVGIWNCLSIGSDFPVWSFHTNDLEVV
jgi:hypothetical protein